MAEFALYPGPAFLDGTIPAVEATEEDYRKGLSKVLKIDWLSDVFTVASYPLLRAIYSAANADGTFTAFAADNPPYGTDEFAMRFKYDEAGISGDDADKLRLLMDIAVKTGGAKVVNGNTGKIYITAAGATNFANAAEAALARGV